MLGDLYSTSNINKMVESAMLSYASKMPPSQGSSYASMDSVFSSMPNMPAFGAGDSIYRASSYMNDPVVEYLKMLADYSPSPALTEEIQSTSAQNNVEKAKKLNIREDVPSDVTSTPVTAAIKKRAEIKRTPFLNSTQSGSRSVKYDALIDKIAQEEGVDPKLIKAMIKQESGHKTNAVSYKGAGGLMQLMPATAKELGVQDRFDPEQNIRGGTKYIKQHLKRYNGDVKLALAAYNAGAGSVNKHGGVPPYKETQNYVRSIIADYENS